MLARLLSHLQCDVTLSSQSSHEQFRIRRQAQWQPHGMDSDAASRSNIGHYKENALARQVPGVGVGSHHDAEDLLTSPQLHGLQDSGWRQVNMLISVTHVRTKLPKITSAVEAVFGGQQECRCQEVLRSMV